MCMLIYMFKSVKLTLFACVWQWSCVRYTWAVDVDVGGAGET